MSNFFTIICETLSQPPTDVLPSALEGGVRGPGWYKYTQTHTHTHAHTCWSFSFWFYGTGLLFNIPTLLSVCLVNRSNDRAMVAPSNVSLLELKAAQLSISIYPSLIIGHLFQFPILSKINVALRGCSLYWSTTVYLDKCTSQTEQGKQVSQTHLLKSKKCQWNAKYPNWQCKWYALFACFVEELGIGFSCFARKFGNMLGKISWFFNLDGVLLIPLCTHFNCCKTSWLQNWLTFDLDDVNNMVVSYAFFPSVCNDCVLTPLSADSML